MARAAGVSKRGAWGAPPGRGVACALRAAGPFRLRAGVRRAPLRWRGARCRVRVDAGSPPAASGAGALETRAGWGGARAPGAAGVDALPAPVPRPRRSGVEKEQEAARARPQPGPRPAQGAPALSPAWSRPRVVEGAAPRRQRVRAGGPRRGTAAQGPRAQGDRAGRAAPPQPRRPQSTRHRLRSAAPEAIGSRRV